jgi:hypothetical protein
MNFLYPRNRSSNNFNNILPTKNSSVKALPTQYNLITYDNHSGKLPCSAQAQLPCNIKHQQDEQCSQSQSHEQLSDSEIALIYKEAYEQAGAEVLKRTLSGMQSPNAKSTLATTATNATMAQIAAMTSI